MNFGDKGRIYNANTQIMIVFLNKNATKNIFFCISRKKTLPLPAYYEYHRKHRIIFFAHGTGISYAGSSAYVLATVFP